MILDFKDRREEIRIIDYFHWATKYSLMSDSNLHWHRIWLKYLGQKYPDLYYFWIFYPREYGDRFRILKTDGVYLKLCPIEYPTTANFAKEVFDLSGFEKQYKGVADVLFLNTPQLALPLVNFLASRGQFPIPITYTHYASSFETMKQTYGEFYGPALSLYSSYFISCRNFANSEYAIHLYLENLKDYLPEFLRPSVKFLREKFEKLPMAPDWREHEEARPRADLVKEDPPILIWNYRLDKYEDARNFFRTFKILLDSGLEFRLFLSSLANLYGKTIELDQIPEKYLIWERELPYHRYLEMLWRGSIIIGPHIGLNPWSLSFLDGIFTENIPLHRAGGFYPEMLGAFDSEVYTFSSLKTDFPAKLKHLLRNIDLYREKAKKISEGMRKMYDWNHLIDYYHGAFQWAFSQIRLDKKTEFIDNFLTPEWLKKFEVGIYWKDLHRDYIGYQRSFTLFKTLLKKALNLEEDLSQEESFLYFRGMRKDRQRSLDSFG